MLVVPLLQRCIVVVFSLSSRFRSSRFDCRGSRGRLCTVVVVVVEDGAVGEEAK